MFPALVDVLVEKDKYLSFVKILLDHWKTEDREIVFKAFLLIHTVKDIDIKINDDKK